MRTVVIWDTQIDPIQFFILEGDYRHLNGTYINSIEDNDRQEELNNLLAYNDRGVPKVEMLEKFPLPLWPDDVVIVAGFLP